MTNRIIRFLLFNYMRGFCKAPGMRLVLTTQELSPPKEGRTIKAVSSALSKMIPDLR